jgi:hypothetical protein
MDEQGSQHRMINLSPAAVRLINSEKRLLASATLMDSMGFLT